MLQAKIEWGGAREEGKGRRHMVEVSVVVGEVLSQGVGDDSLARKRGVGGEAEEGGGCGSVGVGWV